MPNNFLKVSWGQDPLDRSTAENTASAFERTKKWLMGDRGKGIDDVETSRKVKGKEKGRRLEGHDEDSNKKRYRYEIALNP